MLGGHLIQYLMVLLRNLTTQLISLEWNEKHFSLINCFAYCRKLLSEYSE